MPYMLVTTTKSGGLRNEPEASGGVSLATFNLGAVGSSPTGLTNEINGFRAAARAALPTPFPRNRPRTRPISPWDGHRAVGGWQRRIRKAQYSHVVLRNHVVQGFRRTLSFRGSIDRMMEIASGFSEAR